jgi:Cu/Ag efflux pump CusA
MKPGLPDVDFDTTIFRPATFIEMSIENLTNAILIGAILVIIVLLLFLYEWRIALISATIIPLSLMATMLVLPLFGAQVSTINVMVLAGLVIAVGAVVDDAIVDVENIVRRLREQRKAGADIPTSRIVIEASVEVRNAILYASLIEAVALMPVFFLEGLSGAFFQPLALAYVIAVLVSGLIALTVTPALSYILLRNVPLERLSVAVAIAGRPVAARVLPEDEWTTIEVGLRDTGGGPFRRVDLRANQEWDQEVRLGQRPARRPISAMVGAIEWTSLDSVR